MKIISIFNNKGGVGKTTLLYNTAYALANLGKRILVVDCDPQCNLSLNFLEDIILEQMWQTEDEYIDDSYQNSRDKNPKQFKQIISQPRSLHFYLKPTEEGLDDPSPTPIPYIVSENLHLLPGRLTMYLYEDYISKRWNDLYSGDPLAVRTVTKIRNVCTEMSNKYNYDYILLDTSPSLGSLNKIVILFADYFMIPCNPDMFSLYGIKNIGNSMKQWISDINIIYSLLSETKRKNFPENLIRFIGYCIYKAKRYKNQKNEWNLAQGHYTLAKQIPIYINKYICGGKLDVNSEINDPIGDMSVMYYDNTHPSCLNF